MRDVDGKVKVHDRLGVSLGFDSSYSTTIAGFGAGYVSNTGLGVGTSTFDKEVGRSRTVCEKKSI